MEIEEEDCEDNFDSDSLDSFGNGRERALTLSTVNSSIETPIYCQKLQTKNN